MEQPPTDDIDAEYFTLTKVSAASLRISANPLSSVPLNSNLLSISNSFGWLVAGTFDGFALCQLDKLHQTAVNAPKLSKQSIEATRNVSLNGVPSFVSFANGGFAVIANAASMNGQIGVWDTKALIDGSSTSPSHAFPAISQDPLVDICPNPAEFPHLVAVVAAEGQVTMLDLNTKSTISKFGQSITAVCWSVRGKQIVCGTSTGDLIQYTPQGEAKGSTPPPQSLQGYQVLDIQWLENNVFLVHYNQPGQPGSAKIVAITKGVNNTVSYQQIIDPAANYANMRGERRRCGPLKNWTPLKHAIFVANTATMQIGVVGQDEAVWALLEMKETSSASLPTAQADSAEVSPVGLQIDFTDASTGPIAWAYSTDGIIIGWKLANSKAGSYPGIQTPSDISTVQPSALPQPTATVTPATTSSAQAVNAFASSPFASTPSNSGFGTSSFAQPKPSPFATGTTTPTTAFGQSTFGSSAFGKPSTPAPVASSSTGFGGFAAAGSGSGGGFAAFTAKPATFGSTSGAGESIFASSTPTSFATATPFGQAAASKAEQKTKEVEMSITPTVSSTPSKQQSAFGASSAFGQSSAFGPAKSVFGATPTIADTPSGSGSFTSNTSQPATTGFSFANAPSKPAASSPFGSSIPSQSSMFGSTPSAPSTAAFGGLRDNSSSDDGKTTIAKKPAGLDDNADELEPTKFSDSPFGDAPSQPANSDINFSLSFGQSSAPKTDKSTGTASLFGNVKPAAITQKDEQSSASGVAPAKASAFGNTAAASTDTPTTKPTFSFANTPATSTSIFSTPTTTPPAQKSAFSWDAPAKSTPPDSATSAFSLSTSDKAEPQRKSSEKTSPSLFERMGIKKPEKTPEPESPTQEEEEEQLEEEDYDESGDYAEEDEDGGEEYDEDEEEPYEDEEEEELDATDTSKLETPAKGGSLLDRLSPAPATPASGTTTPTKHPSPKASVSPKLSAGSSPSPFSFATKPVDKAAPPPLPLPTSKEAKLSTPSINLAPVSQSVESKSTAPSFNFAQPTKPAETKPTMPTFSFAQPIKPTDASPAAPAFSFSQQHKDADKILESAPAQATQTPPISTKPSFSFGAIPSVSETKSAELKPSSPFSGFTGGYKAPVPKTSSPLAGPSFDAAIKDQNVVTKEAPATTKIESTNSFKLNLNTTSDPKPAAPSFSLAATSTPTKEPFAGLGQPMSRASSSTSVASSIATPVPKIASEAGSNVKVTETGIAGEFLKLYLVMNEELELLRKNAEKCTEYAKNVGMPLHNPKELKNFDMSTWSLGDLKVFKQSANNLKDEAQQASDGLSMVKRKIADLQSMLLKTGIKRDECARFIKAREDPEFAKMIRVRQLGPEQTENQKRMRHSSQNIHTALDQMEVQIAQLKEKVINDKLGRKPLKAPSLDSIHRAIRNISDSVRQKGLEIDDLLLRIELQQLSVNKSATTSFARESSPASNTSILASPNTSLNRSANRPPIDVRDLAKQALKSERSAAIAKAVLLANRPKPLKTKVSNIDSQADRGGELSVADLQSAFANGPITCLTSPATTSPTNSLASTGSMNIPIPPIPSDQSSKARDRRLPSSSRRHTSAVALPAKSTEPQKPPTFSFGALPKNEKAVSPLAFSFTKPAVIKQEEMDDDWQDGADGAEGYNK